MTTKKKTTRRWQAFRAALANHYAVNSTGYGYLTAIAAATTMVTCTPDAAHATMAPALDIPALVLENTISNAVHTATVSAVLSCPESGAGRGVSTSSRHGCGQGAPVREAGGAALLAFSTPCPPYALENAAGGFLSRNGA